MEATKSTYAAAYAALAAHAEEIAAAARFAPPGSCVRAEAAQDGTWRGLRLLTPEQRNDPEEQGPVDGAIHIFEADPSSTVAAIVAEVHDWATRE